MCVCVCVVCVCVCVCVCVMCVCLIECYQETSTTRRLVWAVALQKKDVLIIECCSYLYGITVVYGTVGCDGTKLKLQSPIATIRTARCNTKIFSVLPTHYIYVFCVDLRTNSDYFPIQH